MIFAFPIFGNGETLEDDLPCESLLLALVENVRPMPGTLPISATSETGRSQFASLLGKSIETAFS